MSPTSKSVFKDRGKLGPAYLPNNLVNREDEFRSLARLFRPVLESEVSQRVLLYGSQGSGKTAITKTFGTAVESAAAKRQIRMKFVYVDCREWQTLFQVAWKISESLGVGIPQRGYSIHHCFREIKEVLLRQDARLILALDWLGFQVRRYACDLAYLLTRQWDGEGGNRISLIAATREPKLFELFDAPTKSTFMHNRIELRAYSKSQLKAILLDRASAGFARGAVSEEVVDYVSEIASAKGDAGLAIRLLRKAGDMADDEKAEKVSLDHVEKAKLVVHPYVWEEEIEALSEHEHIVFNTLEKLLKRPSKGFILTGELEVGYVIVCRSLGVNPVSHGHLWKILKKLSYLGFIETDSFRIDQNGISTRIRIPTLR